MFSDLLPELTDLESFTIYTGNLPTQTTQMKEKKVLRVKEPLND
jgi:hypothetical protein